MYLERIPILFCCCCWAVTFLSFGFNIDTAHHVLLSGPPGSYYGYAVALVKNRWVFVGAPRNNDTTMPDIVEPGTIHKCQAHAAGGFQCDVMYINNSSGTDSVMFNGASIDVIHGKNHSWLGGSIEVPNEQHGRGIVTCAHKWYNRVSTDKFRMNGMCYEIPLDLTAANIRMMPAMVNPALQTSMIRGDRTIYNFGMASMGASVHYTDTDSYLLLGTPGVQDWTGGFVKLFSQSVTYSAADIDNIKNTKSQLLGYSASSGRYFGDGLIYFAFGIPRSNLTGKVVLFREDRSDYALWQADLEINATELDGTEMPMNAYFGACLHSVDVDNDGNEDLLVGAPLYSQGPSQYSQWAYQHSQGLSQNSRTASLSGEGPYHSAEGMDQGRVFVYFGRSSRTMGFKKSHQVLRGSEASHARFGSAIMGLGDINRDSYKDVAIGAPYEDDMCGAVYIYNGYSGGLWPTHSQRISAAADIAPFLRGFGASFSKAAHMNGDNVNDVAVGAYLSDNAVLLYGRPVMHMAAHMEVTDGGQPHMTGAGSAQMTVIGKNMTQVTVRVCFMFDDRICKHIDLQVTLTLDEAKVSSPRLLFTNSSQTINTRIRVFRTDTKCTDAVIGTATVKSRHDLVTPVIMVAQYTMVSQACSDSTATVNRFNGSNPHDPLMKIVKELHFKKDCPDNICLTDLQLSATTRYPGTERFFVIGEPAPNIDVVVLNDGHPSYGSVFQMKFSKALLYKKVMKVSGDTEVRCELEYVDISQDPDNVPDTSTLVCEIGNPLYNNSGIEFTIQMEWSANVMATTLEFYLDVTTQSEEINATDNSMMLNIDLRKEVSISFSGISDPDLVFISPGKDNYSTEHVYELDNRGPSSLPKAIIEIFFPLILDSGDALFHLVQTKVTCRLPCSVNCTLMSYMHSSPVRSWINGRLMSNLGILVTGDNLDTANTQDCTSEMCISYKCSLSDLLPQHTAVVSMEFAIEKGIVQHSMNNRKSLKLTSQAFAVLNDSSLITNSTKFEEAVSTDLFRSTPEKEEVSWWIIVVSVACGVLQIVILVAVLYKVGFFKRMTPEEMVRLHKARVEQHFRQEPE